MNTAACRARHEPPPRFQRVPTPPLQTAPSATASCLDGSSPQAPLIDNKQAQRDGKESGWQPDRMHAPSPAGDRADQRACGEREDQCAVDATCPAGLRLLLDETA